MVRDDLMGGLKKVLDGRRIGGGMDFLHTWRAFRPGTDFSILPASMPHFHAIQFVMDSSWIFS